jgi:MFS family permease
VRRYLALARLRNGPRLLVGLLLVAPGQAAVDLVILLALHHITGSFGPGGIAVAAETIAFSISTVIQGRLIDRFGIHGVLVPTALALALATAALTAAVALAPPATLLIGLSVVLGACQPATTSAAASAWMQVTKDDPDARTTAFSFGSVAQEIGFVVGPALFGLLATILTPAVSLACCGGLTSAGALAIGSADAGSNREERGDPVPIWSLLRTVRTLLPVVVAVGFALGTVDVSAPAFASQHGEPKLAGVLVAAGALGGLFGGLAYGARSWKLSAGQRLLVFSALLGLLLVLPALAPTPLIAAAALLIAGAPIGATLTSAYLLAGELLPEDRATVGFSLVTLALTTGAAAGYAIGAQVASHASARHGFLIAAGAAIVGALGAASFSVVTRRAAARNGSA